MATAAKPLDTKTDEQVVAPPPSMAPGLGTIGGAPADADSQAKPADTPPPTTFNPQALPEPPGTPHPSRTPAIPFAPDVPEVPVEKPKAFAPDVPGVPVEEEKKPAAGDQPKAFAPDVQGIPVEQPSPTPMPSGTGAGSSQGSPLPSDPEEQIAALVERGMTSGQAQALVKGEIPKSISGKTPPVPKLKPPPQTTPPIDNLGRLGDEDLVNQVLAAKPTPTTTTPPDKSSTASGEIPGDTTAPAAPSEPAKPTSTAPIQPADAKQFLLSTIPSSDQKSIAGVNKMFQKGKLETHSDDGSVWWTEPDGTSTQIASSEADIRAGKPSTAPAGTADEPKTVVGGANLRGTATSFGLNYDGSYDKDDNGIGFFGGVNTRNPKLQAVAVPVDVLEATFGKFTQPDGHGGYNALSTPEAKKIIAEIRSAHVEALGLDGKIHSFPIVDIQGSLKGHPGKVLDMTPAAGRALGFNDNHSVSYQIVGGDGKPYAIPADQLAGWNSGEGGGGKGSKKGTATLVPMAGSAANSPEAKYAQTPEATAGGGGGGGQRSQAPESGGSGSTGLISFGGGGGAEQASASPPPRYQSQQMSVQTADDQNPVVAALMQRGFTPQQALNYAQGVQNIAPGKGIGPLTAPPPAPVTSKQLVTPKLLSAKQLMPTFKVTKAPPAAPSAQTKAPLQLGPPTSQQAQAPRVDPSVVLGLMKKGFTRQQAIALASKATVTPGIGQAASFRPSAAAPPAPAAKPQAAQAATPPPPTPKDQPKARPQPVEEPTEFTGRPAGSTHRNPNPPGMEALTGVLKDQGKQHKALLSPDDPRVSKQADGYVKGEHFVEGDPFHESLLSGLPHGKQGRQRQLLGQAETAIADKSPLHLAYISAPKEAEKFPNRDTRKVQYEEHSPEARLMGTTEGQLVGHSLIPLNVGVKLGGKGEPHQSYIQGISTNILANNFQHVNDKLAGMGRKTPYKELGAKFANDLEGYFHNLNAGHTATGSGYAVGTEDHPNEPDTSHVPYKLTRREADFLGAVINNDSAFAKHSDAAKIRELARANGTLIDEKTGETNRLRHDIEQHEPGWRKRVLEPSIRTFKVGLIHSVHPSEEHLPAEIRPGKGYQALTKALARTTERGRPDVQIGASLHHNLDDNRRINQIERDFSEHRIDEAGARKRLEELGEDPSEYRFIGGSGGLISPYETDPEAISQEEHDSMHDNLRKQWVGGKLGVDDYRKKTAEIPLPTRPSKPPVSSKEGTNEPEVSASSSVSASPRPRLAESESEPRRATALPRPAEPSQGPSKSAPSPEPLAQPEPEETPAPAPKPQPKPEAETPETSHPTREELKTKPGVWWHGSPSGNLKGGKYGLHLGTHQAATEALHARIGVPAKGEWDGTQEYGKTLLAGQKTLKNLGHYPTGHNAKAPEEDYLPTKMPVYSDGSPISPTDKPSISPFKLTGPMSNSPQTQHSDRKANAYMTAAIKKGTAKQGYFYRQEGEDAGSTSIVVPHSEHVKPIPTQSEEPAEAPPSKAPAPDEPTMKLTKGKPAVSLASAMALHAPDSILANLSFGKESHVSTIPDVKKITTPRGREYNLSMHEYSMEDGRKRFLLSAGDPKEMVDAGAIVKPVGDGAVIQMINGGQTFDGLGGVLAKHIKKKYGTIYQDEEGAFTDVTKRHSEKLPQFGKDMPMHESGHPMPRNPRHALTLPPGTHFKDPDGNIRMVPHAEEKAV